MGKKEILLLFVLLPVLIFAQDEPGINEFIFVQTEPEVLNLSEVRQSIEYPPSAVEAGLSGTVVARVLIDQEGKYVRHEIVKSIDPSLDQAVSEKVSNLLFSPAERDGQTVAYWFNVPFPFRLIDEREQAIRTQIDSLTEVLETDRDDYVVWQKRGVLYNDLGEFDRAVVDFTESLAVNPKKNKKKKPESYAYLFYAYFSRGISYIQQESFEEAIEDFSSAITVAQEMKGYDSTVQASLAGAYLERGYSYAVEQDFAPAKTDLKRVLELSDSLDCEVYPLLVDIGLEEKNNQDLVDAYTGMISCRESINQFYSRGYYRSEIEDYTGAIQDMEKVQAESNNLPLRIAAHNRIAYCQLKLGDLSAARTAVTKALDINAVNNLSHYYLGMLLEEEGKPDEACASMRKALYFGLEGPEGDDAKAFLNEKCGGWEE